VFHPRAVACGFMLLERALLVARACSLAFLPPYAIPSSPYANGLQCIAQVEDPGSLAGATLLYTADQLPIIACRGSSSLRNFRTNFDIGPVPLTIGGKHPTARVHAGFQKASEELWNRLQPCLPPGPVLVTGHSLGGGTATLLALHARAAGREVELITVAGPRLGNAAFAEHYRKKCAPAVHLVHEDDDVLKSNVELWDNLGFEHVGRVVRCDKDAPCVYDDEGDGAICLTETGGAGPPSLQGLMVDHCQYMGTYIGVRLEHPSVWLRPP
jgi:hypothetical protein